jgi:peroxiredoxin
MRTVLRLFAAALAVAALAVAGTRAATPRQPHDYALLADEPRDGSELIGRRAPAFSFERWLRSPSLTPQDLRGKVVLLRWWTERCDYCAATLPGLETLRRRYGPRGFVVIGVYHPKPPRHVSDAQVLAAADRLGFKGPIALDERWSTLDRYWLTGHEREFTSVSFLIDRDGIIRWVHPGGEYHPSTDPAHARCDADYRGLEKTLAALLAPS